MLNNLQNYISVKNDCEFQLIIICPESEYVDRIAVEEAHPNADTFFFARNEWYIVYDFTF